MRVNFGEWLPDQPGVAGALVDAKNVIPQQVGYGPLPAPAEWSNAAAETLSSVVAASAPNEAVTVFAGGSTKLFKLETNLSLSNVSKAGNYVTPYRDRNGVLLSLVIGWLLQTGVNVFKVF